MPSHDEWIEQQILRHHKEKYGGSFRIHIGSTDKNPKPISLSRMPREIKERVFDKLGIDKSQDRVKIFLESHHKDEFRLVEKPSKLPEIKPVGPIIVAEEIKPLVEEPKKQIEEVKKTEEKTKYTNDQLMKMTKAQQTQILKSMGIRNKDIPSLEKDRVKLILKLQGE